MMNTLDISEARKQFNTLDERLRSEGVKVVYVTRHNKKVFAVVDLDYLASLKETIEVLSDKEAMDLLRQGVEDIQNGRVYDHEEVKRDLL